jgi:pyruvate formate-lyase activating enzyme-like uncharacterized protein
LPSIICVNVILFNLNNNNNNLYILLYTYIYLTNWSIFKQVAESDYDKIKLNLIKHLTELNSYEKKIIEMKREKKEQNNALIKSIKMQIENESNKSIKKYIKKVNNYSKEWP